MTVINILVVEDDGVLNDQLTAMLQQKGYIVDQCFDGEAGLLQATTGKYQLILLDVMLPVRDGFSLLKILRKSCQTPVIMVTAKGAEQERVQGFSQGADDYVAKPFSTAELILRIEAILRRSCAQESEHQPQELSVDSLLLNSRVQSVSVAGQALEFTPIQFKLLWELLQHRGEVLSKAYLYQRVLNRNIGAYDRSLDMHLSRVRRKLTQANWSGERLQTSHGKGYCLI
ncbi:response regulator transcription factor [Shewanella pneumatophori]|uniref:Response regulator transcription factor n=1 Tax=Shewanella pneumatophori TaxID=314092 RepID=A0A9X1ZL00_9GAMM|nr:response regulator transcription factor [Shewanella pneumatophori]MCL1137886.1 response regulator transcription factor [Shewanella pneumatophori]